MWQNFLGSSSVLDVVQLIFKEKHLRIRLASVIIFLDMENTIEWVNLNITLIAIKYRYLKLNETIKISI